MRPALLSALAALTAIRMASPFNVTVVLGHSMEPTLCPGSFCVLDRQYYRTHQLVRGDVVVLRHHGETYVKRVSALPGDRLWLLHYTDGVGDEVITPQEASRLRAIQVKERLTDRQILSLILPPGYCFVLGDNPTVSLDSRTFGPVPTREIVGRAML